MPVRSCPLRKQIHPISHASEQRHGQIHQPVEERRIAFSGTRLSFSLVVVASFASRSGEWWSGGVVKGWTKQVVCLGQGYFSPSTSLFSCPHGNWFCSLQ